MSTVTFSETKPILKRSAKIALVVGPVLTLINQWEAITTLQMPDLTKVILTFLVPFCVSFFSGYCMRKSVAVQMCATTALIEELRTEVEEQTARADEAHQACADLRAVADIHA